MAGNAFADSRDYYNNMQSNFEAQANHSMDMANTRAAIQMSNGYNPARTNPYANPSNNYNSPFLNSNGR